MKITNFYQWKLFFKVLKRKEKVMLLILFTLFLSSGSFLLINSYLKYTKIVPDFGEIYKEGIIGQPRFINPIYGDINEIDRDLIELIFSSLLSFNKKGELVKDLAEEYKISEDGKTYEFYLRKNVFWHDGEPLDADDIVFTIKTIQNSDYKSPLKTNWIGVEVKKLSNYHLVFILKNPYHSFLENATLKIIPKHIWEKVPPENFHLFSYNLQPIGSGPFKFKNLKQTDDGFIKSLDLEANLNYYKKPPFISGISFLFFKNNKDLIRAFNRKEIDGFSLTLSKNYSFLKNKKVSIYSFSLPRYFAVFFNIKKSKIFTYPEVRKALTYATNKKEIVDKIESLFYPQIEKSGENVQIVNSPILDNFFNYPPPSFFYEFNIKKGEKLLEKVGFIKKDNKIRKKIIEKKPAFRFKKRLNLTSKGKEVQELQKCLAKDSEIYPEGKITGYFGQLTKKAVIKFQEKYAEEILYPFGIKKAPGFVGENTRKKLNELCFPSVKEILKLQFTLTTVNQPQLIETALILKEQWKKIGAEVKIEILEISELKQRIKNRDYESLLFGEVLGNLPDPFPFWHSSQIVDPGLNLSGYENKELDKLLEKARKTLDENLRKEKYRKFQDILIKDAPAIFLYNPNYLYLSSKKVAGINEGKIINLAQRFSDIREWYIKTKRIWNW